MVPSIRILLPVCLALVVALEPVVGQRLLRNATPQCELREYNFHQKYDMSNGSFYSDNTGSCRRLCAARPGCTAVVFRLNYARGRKNCWLKAAPDNDGPSFMRLPRPQSFRTYPLNKHALGCAMGGAGVPGYHIAYGFELKSLIINNRVAKTKNECWIRCNNTRFCQTVTYDLQDKSCRLSRLNSDKATNTRSPYRIMLYPITNNYLAAGKIQPLYLQEASTAPKQTFVQTPTGKGPCARRWYTRDP